MPRKKGRAPPCAEASTTPKKFQKLVIQTLLERSKAKAKAALPEESEVDEEEEEEEDFEVPRFVGTNLDLTKKRLREFPAELLQRAEFVQYLYLEGNKLMSLPEAFFQSLSHLKWLDLRNNEIVALPSAGLKSHSFLEFLLLQGNRIKALPTELGALPNLKGLQITGNPIANVPYDVIAEGFRSIVRHLRKLNSQESILLGSTNPIVVKTSAVKAAADSAIRNAMDEIVNEVDWEDVNDHPYNPYSSWNEAKKMLLKSKMCPRPKQRIIASSYRHPKRRSRLGYKRRMVTPEMIQEKTKKEMQMARKRETLEKQARKIQRMKDKEMLKTWRRHTQRNADQLKLLDNYQQYPSRNFVTDTPFDVDPEFLNMLNRTDLYRSLKELEAIHKRRRKGFPRIRLTVGDLEKQMRDITKKLEGLNVTDGGDASPRTRQSHLCERMTQMKEIQKTLRNLQIRNMSLPGLPSSVPSTDKF